MIGTAVRALNSSAARAAGVTRLLKSLIAAPSPAGSSGEQAQRICGEFLAAAGFAVRYAADDPGEWREHEEFTPAPPGAAPINMVATPPAVAAMPLALLAHVDTERPGEGWSRHPQVAVHRNGRIFGAGAADAKSGLAAATIAAAALVELGEPAPLVVSVHAKGGGARGTLPTIARLPPVSGVIYAHAAETGGGLSQVKHATRGVLDVRLRVRGWRGTPLEIGTAESAPFSAGGDALRTMLDLLQAVSRGLPAGCEFNVGRLDAGDHAGVVPETAAAAARVLFAPPHTTRGIAGAIDASVSTVRAGLDAAHGRRFVIEEPVIGFRANPAATDWDAPLTRTVRAAVADVTSAEPEPYRAHLASDLRFPLRIAGTPAIGLGPRAGGFYGPDEWVDAADLHRFVEVLIAISRRWHRREEP